MRISDCSSDGCSSDRGGHDAGRHHLPPRGTDTVGWMGEEADKLPIKMLNDRILVRPASEGERRTSAGILIPATAEQKKRLIWAEVCAMGPNVRTMEIGDQVLFSPEARYGGEVIGDDYLILGERDVKAAAPQRHPANKNGKA